MNPPPKAVEPPLLLGNSAPGKCGPWRVAFSLEDHKGTQLHYGKYIFLFESFQSV